MSAIDRMPVCSAYVAVSPHGSLIPSTVRSDADAAWRVLRASITEPDELHDRGWRIVRVECFPVEFVE